VMRLVTLRPASGTCVIPPSVSRWFSPIPQPHPLAHPPRHRPPGLSESLSLSSPKLN
jgi:hypothetical protein